MDISSVSNGGNDLRAASGIDNALDSLQQHGIVIIKNAFNPEHMKDFVEKSLSYCAYIENCITLGSTPDFSAFHEFNKSGLAVNITALDSATAVSKDPDVTKTTFFGAVMNELVSSILKATVGFTVGWTLARVRVVMSATQEFDGRLALHMEKTAFKFPGIHNIWVPITGTGSVSNVDVPGIQFLIGKRQFLRSCSDEEAVNYFKSLSDKEDGDVLPIDSDALLYRPAMKTGDIAIFNAYMPHGGHIPSTARAARVSCDFRVFPWADFHDPDMLRMEPMQFDWPRYEANKIRS